MADADVIIIGSGFGGAITACRLALAGASVIVLERGQEWGPHNFPAKSGNWVFDPADPVRRHGWFDLRTFPNMSVIQGAGVGGGSLVYANISVEAKPDTFQTGWPAEIRYDTLAPHYAEVGRMMQVKPVPRAQWPERTKLLQEAAIKAGWGHRFRPLELAVSFDETTYSLTDPDPYNPAKSKAITNLHGVAQGTCVHLGECDMGCPVNARNTLDLNYLAVAKAHGAVIHPLHLVDDIRANGAEYEIKAAEITPGGLVPKTFTGRRVIVAGGSLGSTELLLKSRASGGLAHISAQLGVGWSSNGDFLTPAIHPLRNVDPGRGPTITAAIDLLDGEYMGKEIFVEDGGLPDLARDALERVKDDPTATDFLKLTTATLLPVLESINVVRKVMPWFAQARDAANGRFSLKNNKLFLDWNVAASEPTMNAVASVHRKLAILTAGTALTPLPWILSKDLITPHPLGGCNMGASAATGVVNFEGQVFGHPGLYVADGAVVPKAIGLNPSRTIGALAEYISVAVIRDL